jgi:EAL domain-containing protein (putative c-di-GMP-specific phosphodiesterase class I)
VSEGDFKALGIKEPVRVSVGIAHASAVIPADLDDLHWQADAAMYAAKRPGHASIALYRPNMTAAPKTLFSSMIANAVHEAITDGVGMQMHYQPIVDMSSYRISHYEALLRIRRDDELIMPFGIFTFVEARSLEVELDRAVVRQVALDLERGVVPPGSGLTVNLAGPTLLTGTIFDDLAPLAAYLDRYEIGLEVTETALITHIEVAGEVLNGLRTRGFKVALDDFGSGYSSLRYLAKMPIDLVKFDGILVRSLAADTVQSSLVEDLIGLIHKAGYQVVAEGVETRSISRRISALGCRYGQGMFYGRPSAHCLSSEQLPTGARSQDIGGGGPLRTGDARNLGGVGG